MIITAGHKIPDFSFDTPFNSNIRLSDKVKEANKTAILFLRYYGCTLCQYDIHMLAKDYDLITSVGAQVLVVLQSSPKLLAEQISKNDLPFEIISDPNQVLYKKFEVTPAKSMAKLLSPKSIVKIAKATSSGYKHGQYEGNELQLPACFIVDQNINVSYAHYGKNATDYPTTKELNKLLK